MQAKISTQILLRGQSSWTDLPGHSQTFLCCLCRGGSLLAGADPRLAQGPWGFLRARPGLVGAACLDRLVPSTCSGRRRSRCLRTGATSEQHRSLIDRCYRSLPQTACNRSPADRSDWNRTIVRFVLRNIAALGGIDIALLLSTGRRIAWLRGICF